jgi:Ca2+-transporting ATPase
VLYGLGSSGVESAPDKARAMAFSLLALAPLAHAWNCRSPMQSAFAARPLLPRPLVAAVGVSALVHLSAVLVPALQPVFRTFPLSLTDAGLLAAMSLGVVFAVEAAKVGYRWSRPAERSG